MRVALFTVAVAVCATLTFCPEVTAQSVTTPMIHNVTIDEGSGVLTITGVGFGRDPAVTIDGQPVVVLQGGSETRLDVLAPAALLITPGSYRLTVTDVVRGVGDAFVVATGSVASGVVNVRATSGAVSATAEPTGARDGGRTVTTPISPSFGGPSSQTVIEDPGFPYRTAIGFQALFYNTTGVQNTASGGWALFSNTTGGYNTATGSGALSSNTTGSNNTASGMNSLYYNTTGHDNSAIGLAALASNTTGYYNTAIGSEALRANNGLANTAIGAYALTFNTAGTDNTATGFYGLYRNRTGGYNTASGVSSLQENTSGSLNTADGNSALYFNTTGNWNTASGAAALYGNTTGINNTAVGFAAGNLATTGSNNIYLGAYVAGVAGESNTMYLGTQGTQTKTVVAGIRGITTGLADAIPVVIDSAGQLGTVSSSRRFKEDIQDMAGASAGIMRLRPVTFRYTQAFAGGAKPRQYGLIAEEVAEVYPDLVVHSADGQIETVQYDKVNAMLLNEVQQQHRELGAQAEQIRALTAQLAALAARLQGIESTRFSTDAR